MAYFNFRLIDSFMDDLNREDCFDSREMDGENLNFKIVLATECANDIERCIDSDGTLITPYDPETDIGANILNTYGENDGLVSMLWSKGINAERTVSVNSTITSYDCGDTNAEVKGGFLVSYANGSGYVIAYDINTAPLQTQENLVMPINGMLWSVKYGK